MQSGHLGAGTSARERELSTTSARLAGIEKEDRLLCLNSIGDNPAGGRRRLIDAGLLLLPS